MPVACRAYAAGLWWSCTGLLGQVWMPTRQCWRPIPCMPTSWSEPWPRWFCNMSPRWRSSARYFASLQRKERFTLFSDHNRSLQRRQPRVHLAAACVNIACCCKSCTVLMMTGCHECLVAYHPPGTHEFLTSVVSAQSHKYLWIPTLPKVHGMAIPSR